MFLTLLGLLLSGLIWMIIGLPWYVFLLIYLPVLLLLLRGYPAPERLGKISGAFLFEPGGPVHSLPPLTRANVFWVYLFPSLLAVLLLLLLPLVALQFTHQILSLTLFITALPFLHQFRRILRYLRFPLGQETLT